MTAAVRETGSQARPGLGPLQFRSQKPPQEPAWAENLISSLMWWLLGLPLPTSTCSGLEIRWAGPRGPDGDALAREAIQAASPPMSGVFGPLKAKALSHSAVALFCFNLLSPSLGEKSE